MTEGRRRRRNSVFYQLGSKQYHIQPVVHDATKAKQIAMWKAKKKPGKSGTFCIYVGGYHWTKRNTEVGFQRQKEEVRCPPKDLMKLLFNPNKNVGVYVENMRKTIFPKVNEKTGKRCVFLSGHCFCVWRSGCLYVEKMFSKIQSSWTINNHQHHMGPPETIKYQEIDMT